MTICFKRKKNVIMNNFFTQIIQCYYHQKIIIIIKKLVIFFQQKSYIYITSNIFIVHITKLYALLFTNISHRKCNSVYPPKTFIFNYFYFILCLLININIFYLFIYDNVACFANVSGPVSKYVKRNILITLIIVSFLK